MKRKITACICALVVSGSAVAQNYQIPNSDFEIWNDENEPGNGWYSFVSAKTNGFLIAIGQGIVKKNTTKIEGKTGSAIQVVSTVAAGKKANGNFTTGRINMGSMTPTDESNYNFTDRSGNANNCFFVGLPDSVSCWATFSRGEEGEYNAQGNFVLHGDIDYKDPNESEANIAAYRIAGGTLGITPCTKWTYFSAPMEYTELMSEKMYMLGSFTTNPTPGATAGDKLQIDDVKFIYNSKLESITIGGAPLEGFDKNTYIYKIKGELPNVDDVVGVPDGKGAQVENQEGDYLINIKVTGNDGAPNQHVYSLVKEGATFAASGIKLDGVSLESFKSNVYSYDGLETKNGIYPVVSVSSNPVLTSVDMQLNDAEHTITIVVTDKFNNVDHTYVLKFTPSDKVINGSQIKGDFEKQTQWGPEGSKEPYRWGTEANGWFSSNVTQLGTMKFVMVEKESHEMGEDKLAMKMINGRPGAFGIESNAPGYIALGAPWVYADMIGLMTVVTGQKTDADDSNGGTIGGINFSYQPDSIVGYYKRTYAGTESGLAGMNPNEDAKIIAYLWKGISASMAPETGEMFTSTGSSWQLLIDRDIDILGTNNSGESADGITLVASAEKSIKELADWTRISVPLDYISDEKPEKANVIISSADYFNRANIGNGNTLSADNVAFVYNSKLNSITIAGIALDGFDKNTYAYEVDGAMPIAADVMAKADGKGAIVEVTAAGKVITITVKGNDIADNAANYHTYTLTFKGGVGIKQDTYNDLSVKGIESGVVVEGVQSGDRIEVYSVQGVLVSQSTANGTITINGLSSNTIYLVKVGSYVTRIMTK